MGDGVEGGETPAEILRHLRARLEPCAPGEAEARARLLLGHVIGVRPLDLYALRNARLAEPQRVLLESLAGRAAAGEPVQYVVGHTDFLGRRFRTDRRALIPRPETELLVETVLGCAELWEGPAPEVADVGTGSGCIAISLAAERPQGVYHAVDASPEALALAAENAALLGMEGRVRVARGDLLDGFAPGSLDAVVSNPPYIASDDVDRLPAEIRLHEPRLALDGGRDGLEAIRRLVASACGALRRGGRLFLEVGAGQAPRVRRLLEQTGFSGVGSAWDLGGHERIVQGTRT